MWTAKGLPEGIQYIPNNAIIHSSKAHSTNPVHSPPGMLGLSNGDSDGDKTRASSDPVLVDFLENTPDGQGGVPQNEQEREREKQKDRQADSQTDRVKLVIACLEVTLNFSN